MPVKQGQSESPQRASNCLRVTQLLKTYYERAVGVQAIHCPLVLLILLQQPLPRPLER